MVSSYLPVASVRPKLLLLPSLVALAVFVYVFIGTTFWVSLSNWRTLKPDLTLRQPLFATYAEMFAMPRWQADLRNTFVFTVFFLLFGVNLNNHKGLWAKPCRIIVDSP